jgi:hypothetical protein
LGRDARYVEELDLRRQVRISYQRRQEYPQGGSVKRKLRWLRTDEREDAVRSLEWSAEIAKTVCTKPHNWKWLLISLHNAVQGYMVVALEKGNGLLTLRPKVAEKWLAAFDGDGPYPVEKLDDFLPLYEKIKNPVHFREPFCPSAEQNRRIERLHELRCQFMHFTPRGWGLELAGLPDIVAAATHVASWTAFDADAAWYKASHGSRTAVATRRLIRRTKQKADAS